MHRSVPSPASVTARCPQGSRGPVGSRSNSGAALPAGLGRESGEHDEQHLLSNVRVNNDLPTIREQLEPYRGRVQVGAEATFNWYWLIDGLQTAGQRAGSAAHIQGRTSRLFPKPRLICGPFLPPARRPALPGLGATEGGTEHAAALGHGGQPGCRLDPKTLDQWDSIDRHGSACAGDHLPGRFVNQVERVALAKAPSLRRPPNGMDLSIS